MSTALLERPALHASQAPGGGGGQVTLEDVISGAWEGLAAHRTVGCPVCAGPMAPRYGASGAAAHGGRCTACDTTLA